MDDAIAVADKKLIDTLTAASAGAPVSRLFNSGNHDTSLIRSYQSTRATMRMMKQAHMKFCLE